MCVVCVLCAVYCVCSVLSVVVLCCIVFVANTRKKVSKNDNFTGKNHDEHIVGKIQNARNIGELINFFRTIWSTMDPKNPTTPIFPDALFYTSPEICRRFLTSGPIPNAQKGALFLPEVPFQRSKSCVGKGPNQRNTTYIHIHIYTFQHDEERDKEREKERTKHTEETSTRESESNSH